MSGIVRKPLTQPFNLSLYLLKVKHELEENATIEEINQTKLWRLLEQIDNTIESLK